MTPFQRGVRAGIERAARVADAAAALNRKKEREATNDIRAGLRRVSAVEAEIITDRIRAIDPATVEDE